MPSGQSMPSNAQAAPQSAYDQQATRIKTEPGTNGASQNYQPVPNGHRPTPTPSNPQMVADRAARLMQERFGSQANTQVRALQSGLIMPGQRPGLQLPGPPQNQTQAQYQQQLHQQQQEQAQRGAANGQTDGAGDGPDSAEQWNAVMVMRNAKTGEDEMTTVEVDDLIRQYVKKRGRAMEAGGLMLPLSERDPKVKNRRRRKAIPVQVAERNASEPLQITAVFPHHTPYASIKDPARFDGGDESDSDNKIDIKTIKEHDEDAITSDLDDSADDLNGDDDDDDSMSNIMLCMYEKVQRVKNKWKCTLKDGVLVVNGKE